MTLGTNLLLALLWVALVGPITPSNFLVGFALGFIVLWIGSTRGRRPAYLRRGWATAELAGFTVYALVRANVRVARYTVSDLRTLRPAVIDVPLESNLTDGEATLLAMLVTLTPGTLTLDVAPGNTTMSIHFMHVEDADAEIRDIKAGFERRIIEVTR